MTTHTQHYQNPTQHQPHKHKKNTRSTWTPLIILGSLLSVCFLLSVCLGGVLLMVSASEETVATGVTVDGLSVAEQNQEELQQTLTANTSTFTSKVIKATDGERSWLMTFADLGIGIDVKATTQRVMQAQPNTTVIPAYTVDLNQTQQQLFYVSNMANIPATTEQSGRAVEVPVMLNRLYVNLEGEISDGVLELSMITTAPLPPEETNTYTGETTVHVVEQGQELALIAREYGVSVDDILTMNDINNPNLIYVGQELTIPAAGAYQPSQENAPAPSTTVGKAIVVSTTEQRIYAYENGQLIRSHLTSTGLPETPTVKGDYKVYVKYQATDMRGEDYFLPQVPYTMYFYQGYGIHGTYWHNSFGRPMSHGCVNLPTEEAKWFYEWAEVGTPVRVV